MAIKLYSRVEVQAVDSRRVEIDVDIPLRSISGSNGEKALADSAGLLQPLRMAAESTLDHIRKKGAGVRVNVECEIPIGAGLGSSASTTVAISTGVSKSLGVDLSRKDVFKLAFVPERYLHGSPSGVDQATSIYGGTIEFTRPSSVRKLVYKENPTLLLCDSGIHHATKALVGSVVKRSKQEKELFQNRLVDVREISNGVVRALKNGDDQDLGSLMSQNHELLRDIGVSHPKLDRLVAAANQAGALGAKLTGSGGGGCIVAVCTSPSSRSSIEKKLRKNGGTPIRVSQDFQGVTSSIGIALK